MPVPQRGLTLKYGAIKGVTKNKTEFGSTVLQTKKLAFKYKMLLEIVKNNLRSLSTPPPTSQPFFHHHEA
ncbi:MAG: hypothetical protein RL660_1352 [Bacteroidota bacterium]|jgi:hypothetical protein